MRAYIIRRLLLLIPTLLIVSFMIYFMVQLIPGDIIDAMVERFGEAIDRAEIERNLGLDASIFIQYGRWMGFLPQIDGSYNGIFQGNLGVSWWTRVSVVRRVAIAWPVTLELGLMGIIVAQLIALPIGIFSALRQDRWFDYIGRSFAILSISIPSFWLATMVIVYPSIWWGSMPPVMLIHFAKNPLGNLKMFLVPAIILGMGMSGYTMRMTRTMMLEVLRQDYIRTAWAKGLRERIVVLRHAVKNALIPVVTLIGLQLPVLLGGAVIIEKIFNLPGMGRLVFDAISNRDYPVVSGMMLIFGVFLMLVNLIVDITYAYLDPRIHYK